MKKKDQVPQDLEQISQFAKLLLPYSVPDGSVAALWGLPSKQCLWPKNSEEFTEMAAAADAKGEDIYVGVALRREGLGKFVRGVADDCTYVLGVGIDIDIGADGHAGPKKRFPTVEAAIDCCAGAVALQPTVTVHSGGGLHLWWLYREPFEIASKADHNVAANVAREWNMRICEAARKHGGYSVDSVFDLPRVLRIPGTRNRKVPEMQRAVTIIEANNARRYDPADLSDAMGLDSMALAARTVEEVVILGDRLNLDSTVTPNFEKLHALSENDEWFGRLLRRDPICMKRLKDDSASAYDLALANVAVRASWTDQEIADLLIYNRRRHGNDLKLRERYYSMTIAKARKGENGTVQAIRVLAERRDAEAAETIEELETITDPAEKKAEAFALLLKATGVDVVRIASNGKDPAKYRVHLRGGEVLQVGSTRELCSQDVWLHLAIESNSKIPYEVLNPKNWRRLLASVASVIVFEKESDSLLDSVAEYMERAVKIEEGDRDQRGVAILNRRPIILADGRPAIPLSSFSRWLADGGRKVDLPALKARMRALGFGATTLSFKSTTGEASSRTYWISPKSINDLLGEESEDSVGGDVLNFPLIGD